MNVPCDINAHGTVLEVPRDFWFRATTYVTDQLHLFSRLVGQIVLVVVGVEGRIRRSWGRFGRGGVEHRLDAQVVGVTEVVVTAELFVVS